MRIFFVSILAALVTAPVTAASGAEEAGRVGDPVRTAEPPSLEGLSDRAKVDLALSLLDGRDRQLQNFEYKVHESTTNFALKGGARRFMNRDDYEMRRLGDKFWMHLLSYEFYSTENSPRAEMTTGWDGKVSRGYGHPPYFGKPYAGGMIRNTENDNFSFRYINQLLGLRVRAGSRVLPMASLVREAVSRAWTVDVRYEQLKSAQALRVEVSVSHEDGHEAFTAFLDPSRGFMISRFEHEYVAKNGAFNRSWTEVVEARESSGVWVPAKAIRRTGTSAWHEESEVTYDLYSFTIGNVRDADVEVTFPPGAHVVDAIQSIAYTILPDGKYELSPLADTATQRLQVPPKEKVVDKVDHTAVAKYRHEDLVLATPPLAGSGPPRTRWGLVYGSAAVALAGVAVALAVRRRRRRLSKNA